MEFAGARLQRLAPAISRSTAGRAMVYGAIINRPSRMSQEQAVGDMAAFAAAREALDVILAGMTEFTGHVPDDVPVTIGWGTRDRLLRPRQALVAKALLPEARLVPLPGCGHVPMTDDPRWWPMSCCGAVRTLRASPSRWERAPPRRGDVPASPERTGTTERR